MRRPFIFIVMMFVSMCVFLGCEKQSSEVKEKNDIRLEQEIDEQQNETRWTFPLTGEQADHQPTDRVVAVMINNYPSARPQSGLYQADVVHEVLAEGDVTRFLALYQSKQPNIIGPIRSARDYFVELSQGFDALYVCHGWSPDAQTMLKSGAVDYLNGLFYDGTLFWRDRTRKAPHNSYISFEHVKKGAEKNGYRLEAKLEPLPFFEHDRTDALEATTIDILYSKHSYAHVRYEYDGQKYVRSSGGTMTVDRETNTPVTVNNVFVVEADHQIIDDAGRRKINLTAGGRAYLFQKGTMQQVEWRNVRGRLLPYKDGVPLGFVSGKTWIQIVPSLQQVQYE